MANLEFQRYLRTFGKVHHCAFSKSIFFMRDHVHQKKFHCGQNSIEVYSCNICQFSTYLLAEYNHHRKKFHSSRINQEKEFVVKNYKCEDCLFQTNSLYVWFKHQKNSCPAKKSHEDIKIVSKSNTVITRIKQEETEEQNLSSEDREVTGIDWIECKHCSYKAGKRAKMNKHISKHHPDFAQFQCKRCDFSDESRINLHNHILEHHPPKQAPLVECELCKMKCKRNFLPLHKRKHSPRIPRPFKKKSYTCQHCSFVTQTSTQLRNHSRSKHTPELIKWHRCHQCDYRTKISTTLKTHIINHHTPAELIQWLKCDQCDYKAKTKSTLRFHQTFHHTPDDKVKWFYCEYCPYKNKQKKHVVKHTSKHK